MNSLLIIYNNILSPKPDIIFKYYATLFSLFNTNSLNIYFIHVSTFMREKEKQKIQ